MRLSVVIPTIQGREASLMRTLTAYCATVPGCELIVIRDRPCWPAACNEGFRRATGDVVHYGADDLVPVGDWLPVCLRVLEAGELPAAHVWDHVHTPSWRDADNVCDGPPGALTTFTRVPILTREMAVRIGPWPEIIYYADNWVSDAGRANGWPTRLVATYQFVHHWHQTGRLDGDPVAYDAARVEYERLRALL